MPETRKLIVDEPLAEELVSLRERWLTSGVSNIVVRDSAGEEWPLTESTTNFLRQIVTLAAQSRLTIEPLPKIITTTVAAQLLGTTRPTIRKWIEAGIIPAHKVGSHTKLRATDVLALQEKRSQQRREAFAELRAFEEEFVPTNL